MAVPVYSYGKLVGERTVYNDRLLMFILRNRAPERFTDGQAKALNAIGKMDLERQKKQWRKEWRKEWEAEFHATRKRTADAREEAGYSPTPPGARPAPRRRPCWFGRRFEWRKWW